MSKPKVYVVGNSASYMFMFNGRGWQCVSTVAEADLVQFTGGVDINPELYGQEMSQHVRSIDSKRDQNEVNVFNRCLEEGRPMAGICRGAQLLNVLSGGSLYQHVDNHRVAHKAYLKGGGEIEVSSTHHQMMIPAHGLGEVLATARESDMRLRMVGTKELCDIDGGATTEDYVEDVEAVYYKHSECLCYQPHPEHAGYKDCTDFYFQLLDNLFSLKA
jgi:gamma-glutamyl-gamma-aminobutyrate hydrolase PuuD